MLKRTFLVLFLVPTLVLATQPGHTVHGVVMTPEELSALSSSDARETRSGEKSKEDGSGLLNSLKAPFKALGRLFGRKKNDNNKLQRIAKKDLRKFESVPTTRVATEPTIGTDETAVDVSSPAVVTTGSDYLAHLDKGRDLLNAGDFNGAIAELSIAASMDVKSGEVKNLLGIAYEGKGLRDRALQSLKAAVQSDKTNAEYLNNYGFLLLKNHNFDDAIKYLKRATKLSPNDPRIWNNVGLAQCQRGKFDDALVSFVKAVGEFDGRVNLAAQLLRQGLGKDAITHLEVAHSLRPESIEVLSRLTGLYRMTGRISDAESARKSLLALQTSAAVQK